MSYLEDAVKQVKFLIFESVKLIPNNKIRNAVKDFLDTKVPDYFWMVQASSTGKNHPKFSSQIGGLVRHTVVAANYAVNLYNSKVVYSLFKPFSREDLSFALAAILLHDTFKFGYEDNGHTVYSHGSIAADEFYSFATKETTIEKQDIEIICNAISSHMGRWGRNQPDDNVSKFVSLCDYLSAQKEMERFYDTSAFNIIDNYESDITKFINFSDDHE